MEIQVFRHLAHSSFYWTTHACHPGIQEGDWYRECGPRLPAFSQGSLSSVWETELGGVQSHLWGDLGLMQEAVSMLGDLPV